jgi:uncharacterized protein (DUF342 family)
VSCLADSPGKDKESDMPLTANKLFMVNISNDKLIATLSLHTADPPDNMTCEEIFNQISGMKITLDEEGKKAVADFVAKLAGKEILKPVVIARGRKPEPDQPGKVEILYKSPSEPDQQAEESQDASGQSYYDHSSIVVAKEGQELLRLIQPEPGQNGVDVFGKEIPRKLATEAQLHLGPNVRQEGDTVYATRNGKVEYAGGKVSVEPKLEIRGNVDFSTGNIDFPGDIHVGKNVLDLFTIRSGNDIVVQGVAEAAEIHAQQDLVVTGGMAGRDKGIFSAGRDLKSKYITNAKVQAGRNVEVEKEIVQCGLVCRGRLLIGNGNLVGSRTVAMGGATVKTLGSEANVKTILELGIDQELQERYQELAPQIQQRRRKAEKVKQAVEPLLQNQKQLAAEQKEKATELLYQASELEESAEQMIEQLRQIARKNEEHTLSEVVVSCTIYPGCVIRFPRVQTAITTVLSGHVKILPRKIDGDLRIVAVDEQSGSEHDLGGTPWEVEYWKNLDKLLRSGD